ncbi:hypothetical protein BV22DRAFT_1016464 [Leucogyrophana mollusca]|uniref:Uncharacterized protein n=1 Tax=Leucogyrophana mollusca TaxID=85980 RepID=A0ACB8BC55_9AGAM|nr:hypothetical protein BV22DRAFT_1016464 [Leucogyrophana mollusca]
MRILSLSTESPPESQVMESDVQYDGDTEQRTSTLPQPVASTSKNKIPTVVLDADIITDAMAARLSTSFLGHVLFLKSQVPFPVAQLARMPGGDTATRASKKRHELLNSFDTLVSHLNTTFTALSTALALRNQSSEAKEGDTLKAAPVYLAIVLGPTIGAAKSRVMIGIHGLETKIWGERDDIPPIHNNNTEFGGVDSESDDSSDSSGDERESDDDEGEERTDGPPDSDDESDATQSDHSESSLPPSRSPSPSESSSSTSPPQTHAQEQEALRTADRLLSRTLASACAEDDGRGMSCEMAPTQIHVLLRAPRRFAHPAWIPRQNLSTSLNALLADFVDESGLARDNTQERKKKGKAKIEGVWIRSLTAAPLALEEESEDVAEDDELIWWSWDGKLVGFADW